MNGLLKRIIEYFDLRGNESIKREDLDVLLSVLGKDTTSLLTEIQTAGNQVRDGAQRAIDAATSEIEAAREEFDRAVRQARAILDAREGPAKKKVVEAETKQTAAEKALEILKKYA